MFLSFFSKQNHSCFIFPENRQIMSRFFHRATKTKIFVFPQNVLTKKSRLANYNILERLSPKFLVETE